MALTSVAGLVTLLDDKILETQAFALKRLDNLVEEFWPEISEAVSKLEVLYEDSTFKYNKHAALLVSKVYYHLGEYEDALHFALCAEELFDLNLNSEFTETIIDKCIDKYIQLRVSNDNDGESIVQPFSQASSGDKSRTLTDLTYKKLEQVVDKMFDRCFEHKKYKQALGIAIETRRLDIFKKALVLPDDSEDMLNYAFRVVLLLIDGVQLRNQLLRVLVSVYMVRALPTDAVNVCQCLVLMDDPYATADTLERLISKSEDTTLIAYQIGFDLYENATQNFLQRVTTALTENTKLHLVMAHINQEKAAAKSKSTEAQSEKTEAAPAPQQQPESASDLSQKTTDPVAMDTTTTAGAASDAAGTVGATTETVADTKKDSSVQSTDTTTTAAVNPITPLSDSDEEIKKRLKHLISILSGDKVIELHLQFLTRSNKADLRLLERIRSEAKHSVTHNATVIANGIMHCGTTSDQFLRDHLNWLGKAVNWAKFTATATLGVIHKGHEKEALFIMSAYLPKETSGSSESVYIEGGGLFALGLIFANHGSAMTEYLLNQLKETTAEPTRHGACLGLGLVAMGTGRQDIYNQIKLNLYQDDAVTGDAAGIAIGLVMLGTGSSEAIEDLLSYAKDTQHEKIIRGVALGIAMIVYGLAEKADQLIDSLIADNDPILRWSGMAAIAMAYCGTGSNQAVKRLLHAAVSDTSDDVRRWAVTALGFVLFKTPEQVPALVSLLVESYHPHLRYGAAMAVGIACAGTANREAISLLETLLDGTVPFVRQGALIALSMVLIQQNSITCPKSTEFRQKLLKIIGDRHEDLLPKFGAILACGILDAGGCNMTISLQTRTGNTNMAAAVGLLVFQNFWFWYPLTTFISLAFTPTALIALNKDLNMPKMLFMSKSKPFTFAYPQPFQQEKEKKREKVETAVLSVTAKQRRRDADKKQQQQQKMASDAEKVTKMDVDPAPETKEDKEPVLIFLNNPTRVMRAQQRVMSLPASSRYTSLKPITHGGILMVQDNLPNEPEVLVEKVIFQYTTERPNTTGTTTNATSPTSTTTTTTTATTNRSDELSAALNSTNSTKPQFIHACNIGAYLDDEDEDDDDDDEDDEEDEDEDEDEDEVDEVEVEEEDLDEEEEEDIGEQNDSNPSNETRLTPLDKSAKKSGGSNSRKSAKSAGLSSSEPNLPEPFLYVEETSGETVVEPMDVDSATANSEEQSGAKREKKEDEKSEKK